jgi:hypothetical protein
MNNIPFTVHPEVTKFLSNMAKSVSAGQVVYWIPGFLQRLDGMPTDTYYLVKQNTISGSDFLHPGFFEHWGFEKSSECLELNPSGGPYMTFDHPLDDETFIRITWFVKMNFIRISRRYLNNAEEVVCHYFGAVNNEYFFSDLMYNIFPSIKPKDYVPSQDPR